MIIAKGLLFRAGILKDYGDESVYVHGLSYQIRDLNGEVQTGSYDGEGIDLGGRVVLGGAFTVNLTEYLVDAQPTVESAEYQRGFWARLDQLRASFPAKESESFQDGWRAANQELKTRPSLDKARLATLRREKRYASDG